MKLALQEWLTHSMGRPGGDILAVQTLRNAIMAASVLASAAMVALMGILATAHLHAHFFAATAALTLAASAAVAIAAIVWLSRVGFAFQLTSARHDELALSMLRALQAIACSGLLLSLALVVAGLSLLA